MIKKVVFLAIWVAILSTAKAQILNVSVSNKIVLDTSVFTIIPYSLNEWIPFGNVKPSALSKEDIENIEELLISAVIIYNSNLKNKSLILMPLQRYKRQYVAVLNKNGQKVVWINLFCEVKNNNWKKEIVVVQDGGRCYFNLKVNLTKKQTLQLFVNSDE